MRFFGALAIAALLASCADHNGASGTGSTTLPPVRDKNRSTFMDVPVEVESAAPEGERRNDVPSAGDPPGGPAPEPGTILLFGSGLVAMALASRRRSMSAKAQHDSR